MLENLLSKSKIALAISLTATGCTNLIPQNPEYARVAQPLSPSLKLLTKITNENKPTFISTVLEDTADYTRTEFTMMDGKDRLMRFYYFDSKLDNNDHPLVILFNILQDKHMTVSGMLAKNIIEENPVDCIILKPNQGFLRRQFTRPLVGDLQVADDFKYEDFKNTIFDYDNYNAFNIKNIKKIVKYWMPEQVGLDQRFCLAGVSLGGIQAVCATAFFPESKMSIGIMAGGDYDDLFKDSEEDLVKGNKERLLAQYEKKYKDNKNVKNAKILAELDFDRDLTTRQFSVFKVTPSIPTEKVRLIRSLYDTSVPTYTQKQLYFALGAPETREFPCGHYSMALFYFPLKWQLNDWIEEAFELNKINKTNSKIK